MDNLRAEMKRHGVSVPDVATLIGCSEKTLRSKISGSADFTYSEAKKIRDSYFPAMRMEYLFRDG